MMILFMSTRLMKKVLIRCIGPFNMSIPQQLLLWIGPEIQDISELLIKLTLKFSMMLRTPFRWLTVPLLFSKLQCGAPLHVNLVGRLWEFSHMELMVLISIVSMLQLTEDLLLLVMISPPYASTTSQFWKILKLAEDLQVTLSTFQKLDSTMITVTPWSSLSVVTTEQSFNGKKCHRARKKNNERTYLS